VSCPLQAYEHCHQPIVLDDVDGLYKDSNGIRLLKSLCQTEKTKSLSWQTDAKTLSSRRIPRQFMTTSRVVIIANRWKTLNADVAALEDRGHFLHFAPTALNVHRQAATWFWDQEIFDFVAAHLHLMDRPSLRTYVLADEMKRGELDWRTGILARCLTGTALEVAKLRANPAYQREEDRVEAFKASGLGCRATYYNHAHELQTPLDWPQIQLTQSAPPAIDEPSHDILSMGATGLG
jgi:hypothetical protein